MKTAKITEILGTRAWEGPHGTINYINMKLDNGETINLGKKNADAFKVGDSVNYEVVEEGKKWKEVKEQPQQAPRYSSESTNKGAMIGMAFKLAFEMIYDKKEGNYNDTVALATRIYEDAMGLYNQSADTKEEKEEKADLPF